MHGNLKVTGRLVHPSDIRVKESIQEVCIFIYHKSKFQRDVQLAVFPGLIVSFTFLIRMARYKKK